MEALPCRSAAWRALTPPSSGQLPAGFARLQPPLMSNVRSQGEVVHLQLCFEVRDGKPQLEPVHAVEVAVGRYKLELSPGLTYGLAAGDTFELNSNGQFTVVKRGGNLAVRVFSERPIRSIVQPLVEQVERGLGGRVDGELRNAIVFTVPVSATFPEIERTFDRFAAQSNGVVWEFGNVYDEQGKPLNWWVAGT